MSFIENLKSGPFGSSSPLKPLHHTGIERNVVEFFDNICVNMQKFENSAEKQNPVPVGFTHRPAIPKI